MGLKMGMQNFIGAFEAKTHFSQLIERVVHGEEFFITRHGKPVARIIPLGTCNNLESAKNAVVRLQSLAEEMNLGQFDWEEWKSYRDMGRA
jgi:prevent-host-death family protein